MDDAEKRLKHAASQGVYARKKAEAHRRMCVWVPLDKVEEFSVAVARLLKRLSKK